MASACPEASPLGGVCFPPGCLGADCQLWGGELASAYLGRGRWKMLYEEDLNQVLLLPALKEIACLLYISSWSRG